MISERSIKHECDYTAFLRGKDLASYPAALRSAVASTTETRGVRTTEISAAVSSRGKIKRYHTSVIIDDALDIILDYSCTCNESHRVQGMCEHEVALALVYSTHPATFMGSTNRNREQPSSSEVLELMKLESKQAGETRTADISLEPMLRYYFGNWDVQFKVVYPKGSYVLKSIGDFVERMHAGEYYSYGKKLAFTHVPEKLTENSREIYYFMERAISRLSAARFATRPSYSFDYGFYSTSGGCSKVGRELSLSQEDVIELIDVMSSSENGTILMQNDGNSRSIDPWDSYGRRLGGAYKAQIVRANPELHIEIRETADGFGITPPDECIMIASANRMCIWRGRTIYRCTPSFARISQILETLLNSNGLFVAKKDTPQFCATLLPLMENALPLSIPESMKKMKPVACKLRFYFDADKKAVYGKAEAAYGNAVFPLNLRATSGFENLKRASRALSSVGGEAYDSEIHASADAPYPTTVRDNDAEALGTELMEKYIDGGEIDIHDSDRIAALLLGGLAEFKNAGEVFTTPSFDRLLFDRKPRVNVGLSIAGNLINLDISSDEMDPHEVAALLSSYKENKHYHRLKNGAFVDIADMDLAQLSHAIDDLGINASKLAKGTIELPAYQAFYLDSELDDAIRDKSFDDYIESFRSAKKRKHTPPKALKDTLRPYQVEGFEWLSLIADCNFGGILADEMGLGKSLQLITWLLSNKTAARKVGPSLVVCPASLVYNWIAEFEKFAPRLRVIPVAGTKTERRAARAEALDEKRPADVMVTSYDLMRIDIESFSEIKLFSCALDEAQYIKNYATKAARAAKRLNTEHRFALSGTPMENKPSELWSIFDFLMPGLLGSPMRFRENFEIPVLGGDEDATRRLHAIVSPFVLRRTKAEELRDLPEKMESVVYTSLEGEQRKLYFASEQSLRDRLNLQKKMSSSRNDGRTNGSGKGAKPGRQKKGHVIRDIENAVANVDNMSKVEVLAEITRLRQICLNPSLVYNNYHGGSAKLETIMSIVEQSIDANRKMLIFSQFTTFLEDIAKMLDKAGIGFYELTGSTPKKKRVELVEAFNEDDTPAFLISLKAGGTGLNLTGANLVLLTDPWWNAAVQEQASDRAHRIGQTHQVDVIKVIARDTIEERILALQESKAALANSLVGDSSNSLASITADDLIDLLS